MARSRSKSYELPEMLSKANVLAEQWLKIDVAEMPEMPESIDVYMFLRKGFELGRVTDNRVFQFVYRSFYRMDNAGLLPSFHDEYFRLMDDLRGARNLDLKALVKDLYRPEFNCPRRRGNPLQRPSLQFSFVTKLAHTVNSEYPIYDSEIAGAFDFSPSYNGGYEPRLERTLWFYESLQRLYKELIGGAILREAASRFRDRYSATDEIPETKIIDFIFWSAAKRMRRAEISD